MSDEKFFVDSNILIYYHDNTEKEKHEKAKQFVSEKIMEKGFFLSNQIIAEFYFHITTKKELPLSFSKAREILIDFIISGVNIVSYSPLTVVEATRLQEEFKIHFWDALIVATMKEQNIEAIYTENVNDFKKIPWIRAKNPLK